MKRISMVVTSCVLGAVLALQPAKSEPITIGTVIGVAIWSALVGAAVGGAVVAASTADKKPKPLEIADNTCRDGEPKEYCDRLSRGHTALAGGYTRP